MPIVDHAERLITCKLVYYGAAHAGKATNLSYLHATLPPDQVGSLTTLSTRCDNTLFFDYIPLELGTVGAYRVRFQLCAAPGPARSRAIRQQLLQGADAIAFIADSRRECLQANLDCLHDLHLNLADQSVAARSLPFVFQYNKQDLPAQETSSFATLSTALNFRNAPEFAAVATDGTGVIDTLRSVGTQVLRRLGARDVFAPELSENSA